MPKTKTKNKRSTATRSYTTQKVQHTRRVHLFVNLFILLNLILVPIIFYVSNQIDKNSSAQVAGQLFSQGYENGFTGWGGGNQGTVGTYQKNISTAVAREGSYSGRFEVRDGDCPISGNAGGGQCVASWDGERSEVQGPTSTTGGYEGDVRWYKWSSRFASPFDTSKGFQLFSQWHDNGPGSPPIAFYAEGGKILLVANINYGGGSISYGNVLWSTNLQTDKWYDIKMRILWSGDDNKGQVSLWVDGTAVTLTKSTNNITSCSGNTCTVRTLRPGSSTYYKQGLYRNDNYTSTSVVYHDGFVSASSESGLGGTVTTTPPTGGGSGSGGTTTPPTGGGTGGGTTTPPTGGGTGGGTTTPPTTTAQSAFNGVKSIPGTIETEDFDNGGEGVSYHDSDAINSGGEYRATGVDIQKSSEGGFNIGWVASGEWLEYTVNANAGTYDVAVRVAGYGNGSLTLKLDGIVIGSVIPTSTNGWQTYQTVYIKNVKINSSGTKILRMEMGGQPVNTSKITFSPIASTTPPVNEGNSSTGSQNNSGSNTVITPPKPLVDVIKLVDNLTGNVKVTGDIPTNSGGQLVADFNRDGLNDIATDINNDGYIDTKNEILVDGKNDPNLTDLSAKAETVAGNVMSFGLGPLGEINISEETLGTVYKVQIAIIASIIALVIVDLRTHIISRLIFRIKF